MTTSPRGLIALALTRLANAGFRASAWVFKRARLELVKAGTDGKTPFYRALISTGDALVAVFVRVRMRAYRLEHPRNGH
jgi:hypothetical protein